MQEGGVLRTLTCVFLVVFTLRYSDSAHLETLTKSMSLEKVFDEKINMNETTQYVYNYTFPASSSRSVPPRITVEAFHVNDNFPVIVVVWHEKGVISWRIPYVVGSTSYSKISRILCPENNACNHSSSTRCSEGLNKGDFVLVSLTTASPENVLVHLVVDATYRSNFHVTTNKNYTVPPDDAKDISFSPSEPWFYHFKWPKRNTRNTSVVLRVRGIEGHDLCMTLSVQPATCPVLDTEITVGYQGYWQTLDWQGGITINENMFSDGFYVVFILHGDDIRCAGDNGVSPYKYSPRNKRVSFTITENISEDKFYMALLAPLVAYGFLCFLFIAGAVVTTCRCASKWTSTAPPSTISALSLQQTLESQESGNRDAVDIDCVGVATASINDLRGKKIMFVCDLSRKDPRILRKKSDLYVFQLFTVAVFYSLPVAQLMFSYQKMFHKTGNQDTCYYNFLCAYPLVFDRYQYIYSISDFNHVFSNVGYVILGLLFCFCTLRRDIQHKNAVESCPALDQLYGIPRHYGLFYAIGTALVMEGFLSACYHICPNKTNFQFDTSFMYIMAVMCMVKLYHNRHPDINASAYTTFFILAIIIFCGMIGITESSDDFFIFVSVIHVVLCFWLTLKVYNMGRLRLFLDKDFIKRMKSLPRDVVDHPREYFLPDYPSRLILLTIGNALNALLIYIGWRLELKNDFGSYLLTVLLANLMLYFIFYIIMKLINGERLYFEPLVYFLLSLSFAVPSCFFFLKKTTSWKDTPAISRRGNVECFQFLNFYDYHDVWHFLSASGLFCTFMVLLTMDDDLIQVPRSKIRVF